MYNKEGNGLMDMEDLKVLLKQAFGKDEQVDQLLKRKNIIKDTSKHFSSTLTLQNTLLQQQRLHKPPTTSDLPPITTHKVTIE